MFTRACIVVYNCRITVRVTANYIGFRIHQEFKISYVFTDLDALCEGTPLYTLSHSIKILPWLLDSLATLPKTVTVLYYPLNPTFNVYIPDMLA